MQGQHHMKLNTCFICVIKYCPAKDEWEASLLVRSIGVDGGPDFSDAKGLKYSTCMVPWW